MASQFADELLMHSDASLSAVASSCANRADAFAKKKGCFDSHNYEQLLDRQDIDAIYIASTNDKHFELAMNCIEREKPCLVEKPICTSLSDLDTLITTVRKKGVFCMEAMWMLFFPAIINLKRSLEVIGPIENIDVSFCIDVPYKPNHRLYSPALGGGALFDIGIYPLTFVRYLLGLEVDKMECNLSFAPTGTDDEGTIVLTYKQDVTAHLYYSLKTAKPHRAVITGQYGTVTIEDFFHPSSMTHVLKSGEVKTYRYCYASMGYNYEIDEVHRALKNSAKESDIMPLSTSYEILSFMLTILSKSHQKILL